MFTGRNEELKELRNKYSTSQLEVILVSGRRRIGKSQLIAESIKGFEGIVLSYECFKSTYESNLRKIENEIKKLFSNNYLHFNSLFDIIIFLHDNCKDQKILFVLDEYPYMRENDSTDSDIKNAIDDINKLDQSNPLKLIMCGSAVDVMNMLDQQDKPLYGRFTSKIILNNLNYLESASFYNESSLEDKVSYYCVLGGVPYFLKQIDSRLSFDENIIRLFFSSTPLLKTELESQINNEISKIENAPFILDIIKDKTLSYTDILQAFNNAYPNKSIDYVLEKLQNIFVIEKIIVHQDNGKTKPYYRIKDTSIKFYYSFLNYQFANRLLYSDEDYYHSFIENDLKQFFIPHMFENIGNEFLGLMNRKKLLPDMLIDLYPYIINDKVTKHNYQFDVVGQTKNGLINYECKYQDTAIDKKAVAKEERQTELANINFIKTVYISKTKVLDDNIESYYLEDIFSERLL